MKVLAVLEINENKLGQCSSCFEDEMTWVMESGITMLSYRELEKYSETEYASFVWNAEKNQYEMVGNPTLTETLCRNRHKERQDSRCSLPCYDWNKVLFKKRITSEFKGEWEAIE